MSRQVAMPKQVAWPREDRLAVSAADLQGSTRQTVMARMGLEGTPAHVTACSDTSRDGRLGAQLHRLFHAFLGGSI